MKWIAILILALVFAPPVWGDLPPPGDGSPLAMLEWITSDTSPQIKAAAANPAAQMRNALLAPNTLNGGPVYGMRLLTHQDTIARATATTTQAERRWRRLCRSPAGCARR